MSWEDADQRAALPDPLPNPMQGVPVDAETSVSYSPAVVGPLLAERDALRAQLTEWREAMTALFGDTMRVAFLDPDEPDAWDLGVEGCEGDVLVETPAEAVRELHRLWSGSSELLEANEANAVNERDNALAAAEGLAMNVVNKHGLSGEMWTAVMWYRDAIASLRKAR
jgi:hypothetical protein